jgi:hypothetical protein
MLDVMGLAVGGIWYTPDRFASWYASTIPNMDLGDVDMSDGMYALTFQRNGQIWRSENYLFSFTVSNSPSSDWTAVRISRWGQYAVATTETQGIYFSQNFGIDWILSNAPSTGWGTALTMNQQGDTVVAGQAVGGQIYISRDYGATWAVSANSDSKNWQTIACDSSGRYIAAGGFGTAVYTSADYGDTWTAHGGERYDWRGLSTDDVGYQTIALRATIDADVSGEPANGAIYHATWIFEDTDDDDTSGGDGGKVAAKVSAVAVAVPCAGGVALIALAYYFYYVNRAPANISSGTFAACRYLPFALTTS